MCLRQQLLLEHEARQDVRNLDGYTPLVRLSVIVQCLVWFNFLVCFRYRRFMLCACLLVTILDIQRM